MSETIELLELRAAFNPTLKAGEQTPKRKTSLFIGG